MTTELSEIGLFGLGVMGQNLALNIASKGFAISCNNRSPSKVDLTAKRAKEEKCDDKLTCYKDMGEFVKSIRKPRPIIILVKAGKPVDMTIAKLCEYLEPGDIIIDGGNEWFPNTVRRGKEVAPKGLKYIGMGVSGGEEGARNGPSMMPGGPKDAYERVRPILEKCAAQTDSGPCVTYLGTGGAGNYVKMVHNGIEYGDMQLIAEAYDLMVQLGNFTNDELASTFTAWNKSELASYLIEITSIIFGKKDEDGKSYVVDKILDKTGMKGTGRWTVQEAAEQSVPAPTIAAALDARYLSGLLAERKVACTKLQGPDASKVAIDKKLLTGLMSKALYAAKICSYAQGMNLIKAAGKTFDWNLNLGEVARIWKGGCIIRSAFLDKITQAYKEDPELSSLLLAPFFLKAITEGQSALRKVVCMAIEAGIAAPAFSASLAYYDAYRRERLPANLTQAQRDFFGAHTYERVDKPAGEFFHTMWTDTHKTDMNTLAGNVYDGEKRVQRQ